MAVTVPIDELVLAWNNYLKSIHRGYVELWDDGHTLPRARSRWWLYFTTSARRDYGITVLTDSSEKDDPHRPLAIGALMFNNEVELTRFLLTFADPADQGRLCQF